MRYSIAFKDLPFVPDTQQVIYVENQYNEHVNAVIKEKYEWLRWRLRQRGLDFVYFPMFFDDEDVREKVMYHAPYLTSEIMNQVELRSSYLLGFMSHIENIVKISPSFLYAPWKEEDEWVFRGLTLDDGNNVAKTIEWIIDDVRGERRYSEDIDEPMECQTTPSEVPSENCSRVRFSKIPNLLKKFCRGITLEEDDVPEKSASSPEYGLEEMREERLEDIMEDFQRDVLRLRLTGISLETILEWLADFEKVSRMRITDDLRIILPDYGNKEVEISPLYKAVYFLFLNHPEGIVLQRLEDYHRELANYYRQTTGRDELTPRMQESIRKMEVYGNNALNIALTKIKIAFCLAFDERLAKQYIIKGRQGQPYKIALDRNLVEWEDEE